MLSKLLVECGQNGCDHALGQSDGSIFKSAINISRTN